MILGKESFPIFVGLAVFLDSLLRTSLEDRRIKPLLGQTIHFGQQLPCPLDRLFLEVISERPVSQHLEHRVMVRIVSHLFQIVVLTRHAQALL